MRIVKLFLAAGLCLVLCACDKSSKNDFAPISTGTYILNNGNWGNNDSNIGIYNPADKTYSADAFVAANGQGLGDLGQDIIGLGEQLYIAVNGSQTIFITDTELKIKKQINAEKEGARLSPRYLATSGNKVYASFYEGYVAEISSDYSVKLCQVGPNPEGLAVAAGKIYVANSGGMAYPAYNNTLSVISTDSFTETSTIEVNANPIMVEASSDGTYVYVSSFGNYADAPPKLQVVDIQTGGVTDLDYTSVSAIAKGKDDILFILCGGYDENWNPLPGTVYMHDMKANRPLGLFVSDSTDLLNAYSISATADGYVYVGCSDYKNTGDVYVFTPEGKLHDKFDSHGMNPLKAY
ncbi:MAG: hypothetical protein IKZ08_04495 [Bacteroidales bacterium]|nr:hypothetical protein [Bacteroidales bacterium]MBR5862571.1 hypothetical protein [Bacteroidales bacterium]